MGPHGGERAVTMGGATREGRNRDPGGDSPPSDGRAWWGAALAAQAGLGAAACGLVLQAREAVVGGLAGGGLVALLFALAILAARADARRAARTMAVVATLLAAAAVALGLVASCGLALLLPLALLATVFGGDSRWSGGVLLGAALLAGAATGCAIAVVARGIGLARDVRRVARPAAVGRPRASPLALGCCAALVVQLALVPVGWSAFRTRVGPPLDTGPTSDSLDRAGATVTPLPDGRILVAGGVSRGGTTNLTRASAARYDPRDGTWAATTAMPTGRWGHTATVLGDGRVLLVGGYDASGVAAAAADLYDPATDRWSPAGGLAVARAGHGALRLADGRVLVVGGTTGGYGGPVAAAERYDPATNGWTVVAPPAVPRQVPAVTLLADGQVLVLGGPEYGGGTAPPERYDPAADRWRPVAAPTFTRVEPRAVRLADGRVLVAGDETTTGVTPRRWARKNTRTTAATELYDPATDTWAAAGDLGTARSGHTLTLLADGRVLAAGGGDDGGNLLADAERYDPASGRWSAVGDLATARTGHAAALLPGGDLLVVGGATRARADRARPVERYAPASGRWDAPPGPADTVAALAALTPTPAAVGEPVAAPAVARVGGTATALPGGAALLAGGYDGAAPVDTATRYDPATGRWAIAAPLPAPRAGHTATLLPDGRVLVVGGATTGRPPAGAALYDPAADRWLATAAPPAPASGHTATLLRDGRVLVVGGAGAGGAAALYDPVAERWETTGSLAAPRSGHTATLLADGRVLVVGQGDQPGTRTTELYDPVVGTWRAAAPVAEARGGHTATLLPDGQVLVAGGGGFSGQYHDRADAERYDPAGDRWLPTGHMAVARSGHAALALADGRVLVAGGGIAPRAIELFDPRANGWAEGGRLAGDYASLALLPEPDGRVLVVGVGRLGTGTAGAAERYDPRLAVAAPAATVPAVPSAAPTPVVPGPAATSTVVAATRAAVALAPTPPALPPPATPGDPWPSASPFPAAAPAGSPFVPLAPPPPTGTRESLVALWWDGGRPLRLVAPVPTGNGASPAPGPLRLIGPDGAVLATLPLEPSSGNVYAAAIAPDRTRVALGRADGTGRGFVEVWLLPREPGDTPRRLAPPAFVAADPGLGQGVPQLAWTPDGAILAATGNAVVGLFDADGHPRPGGVFRVAPRGGQYPAPGPLAWSPDGSRLLVTDSGGGVILLPRAALGLPSRGPGDAGAPRLVADGGRPPSSVAWAPDGAAFAVRRVEGVAAWRADGTPLAAYAVGTGGQVSALAWGAGGAAWAAYADASRTVVVARYMPGAGTPTVAAASVPLPLALAWSDTGALAGADGPGQGWIWYP